MRVPREFFVSVALFYVSFLIRNPELKIRQSVKKTEKPTLKNRNKNYFFFFNIVSSDISTFASSAMSRAKINEEKEYEETVFENLEDQRSADVCRLLCGCRSVM